MSGRGRGASQRSTQTAPATRSPNSMAARFDKSYATVESANPANKQAELVEYLTQRSINHRVIVSPNFEEIAPSLLNTEYYTHHDIASGEDYDPGYTSIVDAELKFKAADKPVIEQNAKDALAKEIIDNLGVGITARGTDSAFARQEFYLQNFNSKLGKTLVQDGAAPDKIAAGIAFERKHRDTSSYAKPNEYAYRKLTFYNYADFEVRQFDPELAERTRRINDADKAAIEQIVQNHPLDLYNDFHIEIGQADPYSDCIDGIYVRNETMDEISRKIEDYLRA